PSMDDHAQYVAYESFASNLVAADTNDQRDIFARHLPGNTTTRVSLSSTGAQANDSSGSPDISAKKPLHDLSPSTGSCVSTTG
ncbi:MAG: hypothetical protein LC647_16405, partial [Beggiatoa sp.]|nr:hypothetical protein [Beggiatoa sp.]